MSEIQKNITIRIQHIRFTLVKFYYNCLHSADKEISNKFFYSPNIFIQTGHTNKHTEIN